jgi:hypothetical protein
VEWRDSLTLSSAGFTLSPVFHNVTSFSFSIGIAAPSAPGTYNNPALNGVQYSVHGVLEASARRASPRSISSGRLLGSEFHAQGISQRFLIAGSADLSGGLQIASLSASDPVFVFRWPGSGRRALSSAAVPTPSK